MCKEARKNKINVKSFLTLFVILCSFIPLGMGHAQSLRITSPNGGEVWTAGENKNITWTFSGAAADAKVELALLQSV